LSLKIYDTPDNVPRSGSIELGRTPTRIVGTAPELLFLG